MLRAPIIHLQLRPKGPHRDARISPGALIAAYQIGYALAAFTVSPLMAAGLNFRVIVASAMTVLIYPITRRTTDLQGP